MKARDELVRRALSVLGAVSVGQDPSAEDGELVDAQVEPLFANLTARRIYYVADPEQIDDAAFEALARLLAEFVAPDFGRATSAEAMSVWEQMLIRLTPPVTSLKRAQPSYF